MKLQHVLSTTGVALLAACVPQPSEPPPPAPAPVHRPTPPPPPAPPAPADWRDIPLTPGSWSYRDRGSSSEALFGTDAANPSFVLRCEKARGEVLLSRAGVTTGNTMTVRTSFGARNLPLSIAPAPAQQVFSAVPARDSFLDTIAFSRGRFTVEVPGTAMLVIPAWPEPARVIEDCRA